MQTRAFLWLLIVASFGVSAVAAAAEKALDRSFGVQPGGRLSVELDSGNVAVSGTATNQVTVRLRAKGSARELENLKWSAAKDARGVVVKVEDNNDKGMFNWGNDVHVSTTIEVPREYHVELVTAGGSIELRDVHGKAQGRTSGGRITVENMHGEVQMRTSGGAVVAKKIEGPTELHTSGGPIQAEQIAGTLKAHTSGGGIEIDLDRDHAGVNARTSGGSITIRAPATLRATVNASATGGRVKSDFPVATQDQSESSLRGTINGGGPGIHARTSGGGVRIVRRE
jgi:DUF4097 and DUF4098 domain-containing protein YvlB